MIMRYIEYLVIAFAAAVMALSCSDGDDVIVADNSFVLESDAGQWRGDSLFLGWEAVSVDVNVNHAVTSNAWTIKCALDDAWCTYKTEGDVLTVTVQDNTEDEPRQTYVDVCIGENRKRVIILQENKYVPPHVNDPSDLPHTGWDETETDWVTSGI